MNLEQLFNDYKEQSIQGRYIILKDIIPLLDKIKIKNEVQIVGQSVLNKPIYVCRIGSGEIKILLWSQMHGNESTTTKALFDFINVLNSDTNLAKQLLSQFTFCCIPMLNPDGAELYTRENANEVDLNRDSQDQSQPESKILRAVFESFKPDYCFNLHDQRTIYAVADSGKSATVSFLAPAYNEAREVNESRQKAITLIAKINTVLQNYIPGQVGRFDDSFNINCVGDTFQFFGVPTILFEAGHFAEDYEREKTRKFIFFAMISAFTSISENDIVDNRIDHYLNIPQNKVLFYDFIYKNIKINYDGIEIITNFAAQYNEDLINNKICFNAQIVEIGKLENYFGHFEYDAEGASYQDEFGKFPRLNQKANFNLDNGVKFVNGLIKN
jgi:Zinc carboxypeptidase